MARRTLTIGEWLKLVKKHATDDSYPDIGGLPVIDVATKLGVTKQAVHKLIDTDALDAIEITTKAGTVAIIVITQASLDHYLTRRRAIGHTGRFTLAPDSG